MDNRLLIISTNPEIYIHDNINSFEGELLVVFPSERSLQNFYEFHGKNEDEVYYFSPDVFPFEEVRVSSSVRESRLSTLNKLVSRKANKVFTTFHGLLRKTLPPDFFISASVLLKKGNMVKLDAGFFTKLGYERVFTVTEPCQFSIKGDIIDFYEPGLESPVRIEVFDNTVERIRYFNPLSQRGKEELNEICLTPASEAVSFDEQLLLVRNRIKNAEKNTGANDPYLKLQETIMDTVAGIYYKEQSYLLDYFQKVPTLVFVDPDNGLEEYARRERETNDLLADSPVRKFIYTRYAGVSPSAIANYKAYRIVAKKKPETFLWDESIIAGKTGKTEPVKFKREDPGITKIPLIDWSELEFGDLVVHKEYGIGKFLGVNTITSSLGTREYLSLEYRDNSKIHVPVERVDRVHKYIGSTQDVQLNSLKGESWAKQKKRIEKDVKNRVYELARLYGQREEQRGINLPGDEELEDKFRKSFPFVETEDQLRSFEEVKKDLMDSRSMDRLISGDAGYGKTEVAIRAAFHTVVSGKQVALMVPTTVLARQHFDNFDSRLSPFGINVEIIDRYRTENEKKRVYSKLASGSIDLIVGTHSLLSKNVKFGDLGLVIIDEEQLFGVMQKEHFKKLRLQVNVLSMSATPIPRTLYMSISGLRELSVISTPPVGRTAAETTVGEHNPRLIRTAVLREVNRGGQVIYVHNRVKELHDIEDKLRRLIPEIKLAVAHGQMNKTAFEKAVRDFYRGQIDLLLCTTIIESGVDVPNANTLIVDDSQRYGMAQLYQLRGRVGRSTRRSFAYFLYEKKRMNNVSNERLKALKEFSGPGSGLKIAMRDMEIRGFGALLGSEQHGNISSVGLYMYREMLQKAVKEIKGEEVVSIAEKTVDTELRNIPFDMVIPESYISDSIERLKIYRRIAVSKTIRSITELEEELVDRFGQLPRETISLFEASKVRVGAFNMGIAIVEYDAHGENLVLSYKDELKREPFKKYRTVFNERENKVFIYRINERRLFKSLKEIFVGDV